VIILTGAGAGALYGKIRATMDLDFALKFKTSSAKKKERLWTEFSKAAHEVTVRLGIAAHFAEDIDRWSSISYLDYEKHTLPFKRFGFIKVRLLEPPYWAIGKLARYLDPDIRDVVGVMKKTQTRPQTLATVLGRALKQSPRSTACELFRRQVEDFLTRYGRKIWGKEYHAPETLRLFHRQARLLPGIDIPGREILAGRPAHFQRD